MSTSNFTALLYSHPRHNQDTHTTGPNQLNRLIYRYINAEQIYIYQESITSKSVIDLTSQQTPLTKKNIYITAIKLSVPPVHLISVQKRIIVTIHSRHIPQKNLPLSGVSSQKF